MLFLNIVIKTLLTIFFFSVGLTSIQMFFSSFIFKNIQIDTFKIDFARFLCFTVSIACLWFIILLWI